MKELAEEISTRSGGRIVLGSVSLNRFPDSFPDIFISRAEVRSPLPCDGMRT